MQRNNMIFILLIGILVIISAAGYAVFKYLPTLTKTVAVSSSLDITNSDLTADWQTFTSNFNGFSIKYPSNVTPPEDSRVQGDQPENRSSTVMSFSLPDSNNLNIIVWGNPNNYDVRQWMKNVFKGANPRYSNLNGEPVSQATGFAGDGEIIHTFIRSGENMIDVSFYKINPNIPDLKSDRVIFEKMLNTLTLAV